MKKFAFISQAALKAYKALPKRVQHQFGTDLNAVQQGRAPFSSHKFLTDSVGPGAIELIDNGSPAYRAVYCVKYLESVFILHAFEKTTNGVDRKEMATAAKRYKEMMRRVDAEKKRTPPTPAKGGK